MKSLDKKQCLAEAYAAVLNPDMLASFEGRSDDLTGVFLPSATDKPMKLMIVGMETKGWNGAFDQIRQGSLQDYIERSMQKHERFQVMEPGRSSFGRFHRDAAKTLGCTRADVGWGNLFAVAYKKGSPKRDRESFSAVRELSRQLLREQIKILQPQAIIFVTGWRYDADLKSALGDQIDSSNVIEKKALWEFRIGDTLCYRTSHPRYVKQNQYRKMALSRVADHLQ